MQQRTKFFISGICFIFLGIIAWLLLATSTPVEIDNARQRPFPTPQSDTPTVYGSLSLPQTTTPKSDTATDKQHELLGKFNRSQSYRAFIYEALKHPELGGREYAQNVLSRCRKFTLPFIPSASADQHQEKARELLTIRCDMTKDELNDSDNKLSNAQYKTLIDRIRDFQIKYLNVREESVPVPDFLRNEDPLHNLMIDLFNPDSIPEKKNAAIVAVLNSGEPLLLLHVLQSQTIQTEQGNVRQTYFDGQWYIDGENATTLFIAYDLAMCNFGLDCGPTSMTTLRLCATRGYCANNVEDAIRNGVSAHSDGQYEEIAKLASRLTSEIKNKNAKAFMPPSR